MNYLSFDSLKKYELQTIFRFLVLIIISLVVITISILKIPFEKSINNFSTINSINNNSQAVKRNIKTDIFMVFSYEHLNKFLCDKKLDWNKRVVLGPEKKPCPEKGIVTILHGGRTGNKIWDYATVWVIAKRTGLKPYMPTCTKRELDQVFEGLTIPSIEEIASCPVEFQTFVKSLNKWTSANQSIILPRYTLHSELILSWIKEIVKEFKFKKNFRDKAQQILAALVKKEFSINKYTFIGVHVRRTDYINYIKRKYKVSPVDHHFFLNAMAYYKNKYSECIFIFLSDDPKWCSNQFGKMKNVHVVSNTPAQDLAIMAACNHSIFDYGTFGEWGSILAGGETIYSNITPVVKMGTGKIFKNWIMAG